MDEASGKNIGTKTRVGVGSEKPECVRPLSPLITHERAISKLARAALNGRGSCICAELVEYTVKGGAED